MFDIAFSELLVIAIVALVVIGPERLPRVARTAGHMIGRLQRYVNDVKADIDREMQIEELKKLQTQMQESAVSFENSIRNDAQSLKQSFEQEAQAVQQAAVESDPVPGGEVSTTVSESAASGVPNAQNKAAPGLGLDGPEAGVLLPPAQPPVRPLQDKVSV